MLDVDNFKQFNDSHGHPAGDEVLRQLARVLQTRRRANDVVARYGGEEFAILLVDVASAAAKDVADRIVSQIAEFPFEFRSFQPLGRLTISAGVSTAPGDGVDAATVLMAADRALFAAKNAGRNTVRVAGK